MRTQHKLFAIFGNPVSHSISPLMHNYALQGLEIEGCYTRYKLYDPQKLREKFLQLKLSGINITIPYKEAAFKACDEVRGIAKEIEAVNTIVYENQELIGYNTDAPGFLKSALSFGPVSSVCILGAGGTAKALAAVFRENNIDVTLINRSHKRLEFFQERGFICMTWDTYQLTTCDLIVNTTSAGLQDSHLPAPKKIVQELLAHAKYAIDVIYNKQTPFLKLAEKQNIPTKDGSEMLLYQGVYAFNLFFNMEYHENKIETWMRKAFI